MVKIIILTALLLCALNLNAQDVRVTYQKMYEKHATATKDTTLATVFDYYKFTIAPTETDSVIYWSFNNFASGDSMKVVYPQVWNQPDWLDAKNFPRIVVKGASDYILILWGRKKP